MHVGKIDAFTSDDYMDFSRAMNPLRYCETFQEGLFGGSWEECGYCERVLREKQGYIQSSSRPMNMARKIREMCTML